MIRFEISKAFGGNDQKGWIKPIDELIFDVTLAKERIRKYQNLFWTLPRTKTVRPGIEVTNFNAHLWYLENGSKLGNPYV